MRVKKPFHHIVEKPRQRPGLLYDPDGTVVPIVLPLQRYPYVPGKPYNFVLENIDKKVYFENKTLSELWRYKTITSKYAPLNGL